MCCENYIWMAWPACGLPGVGAAHQHAQEAWHRVGACEAWAGDHQSLTAAMYVRETELFKGQRTEFGVSRGPLTVALPQLSEAVGACATGQSKADARDIVALANGLQRMQAGHQHTAPVCSLSQCSSAPSLGGRQRAVWLRSTRGSRHRGNLWWVGWCLEQGRLGRRWRCCHKHPAQRTAQQGKSL